MKGAFLSGFVMAIVGGTASEIGGGKFANGAWGSAFQYLFNSLSLKQSLVKLWNKKGEILDDASQGLQGGLQGYRTIRDNTNGNLPLGIRIWLKSTLKDINV